MKNLDIKISFSIMALLIILVGIFQSWGVALSILNLCLISAVMSMGVNIQWGFAGLINFGVMGFLAIGGLATVLVSVPPVIEAWTAGGMGHGIWQVPGTAATGVSFHIQGGQNIEAGSKLIMWGFKK